MVTLEICFTNETLAKSSAQEALFREIFIKKLIILYWMGANYLGLIVSCEFN